MLYGQVKLYSINIVFKNWTIKKEFKTPIALGRTINIFNNLLVVERPYFKTNDFIKKVCFASSWLMISFSWNSIDYYHLFPQMKDICFQESRIKKNKI